MISPHYLASNFYLITELNTSLIQQFSIDALFKLVAQLIFFIIANCAVGELADSTDCSRFDCSKFRLSK